MILRPKNWNNFQHYKNRNPPWIKLHKGLLDDYEFQGLPVASRALAPMLWLLASESLDGEVCGDPDKIAFRLRMTVLDFTSALKPLVDMGFIEDASGVLAGCKRGAMPETETEKEGEAETKSEKILARAKKEKNRPRGSGLLDSVLSESEADVFNQIWASWPERSDEKPSKGKRIPAEKAFKKLIQSGASLDELKMVAAKYHTHSDVVRGYVQHVSTFFGEHGWCPEGIVLLRAQRKSEGMNG